MSSIYDFIYFHSRKEDWMKEAYFSNFHFQIKRNLFGVDPPTSTFLAGNEIIVMV